MQLLRTGARGDRLNLFSFRSRSAHDVATHERERYCLRNILSGFLLLAGAALAANCGGDSASPASGSDAGTGPGSAGSPGEAGQPNVAGTSGGSVATAGTGAGGQGEAGTAPTAGAGEAGSGGAPSGAAGAGEAGNVGSAGESGAGGENTGGVGDAGGAGGQAPVSICPQKIEDFPQLYAEAICKKRVACCAGDDEETCVKQVTQALTTNLYPDLAKSGQDGSAEPNCPALEQCVAAIAAANCSEWPRELPSVFGVPAGEPACRNIIKGKLAANTACASTYQCDFGFCTGEPTVCFPLVPDGEKCDDGTNLCNLATSYCGASNECVPREPNGAACTSVDECQSRRCDTVDTHQCLAPPAKECKFVPKACSMTPGHVPGSAAWSLLVVGLVLGAGARRSAARRRG
jgi:hypothetical protein